MLTANNSALLILNMQDDILKLMECSCEVAKAAQRLVRGTQAFALPTVVTAEEGAGELNSSLLNSIPEPRMVHMRSAFSPLQEEALRTLILGVPATHWIIIGLETHIAVLQTARDLRQEGKEVVVLNDATASRSIYDYSTAIGELRDLGVRISSTETVLYELLATTRAPQYEAVTALTQ